MSVVLERLHQKPSFNFVASLKRLITPHAHLFMFLLAVSVCGIVFGGLVAGQLGSADSAVLSQSVRTLIDAISQHQLASTPDLWWHRFLSDCQLLALLWLFGVSVIGLPFVVITIFLRSFSIGFAVGFTVLHFGWRGVVVAAIAIFLHQVVSLSVLLWSGVLAIRFSAGILRQVYPLTKMSLAFVKYTALFALCACVLMGGALIQAVVAPALLQGTLVPPG